MITRTEIVEQTREIKLADVRAILGDDYVRAYNRGYAGYTRGTESERYLGDNIAFAGWEAGYCGTKWNDDYTQDAMLAALVTAEIKAEHEATTEVAELAAPILDLDDASRTVELVPAHGINWEATGRGQDVALWLGNATEHDRECIRKAARLAGQTGHALRIEFGSVLPFYLGTTVYGGRTLYRIFVPIPAHTA